MITRKLHLAQRIASQTRREFLNTTASGLGMMGLGSILAEDGMLSAANAAPTDVDCSVEPKSRPCSDES